VILYDSPVSGNCYKVRLLAAHLGLPLERRPLDVIDRSNRPEVIGDKNPSQRVPTLVLDDGRPLGESGAIIWYLARGTRFVRRTPMTWRRCCNGCSSSSTTSSRTSPSRASGWRSRRIREIRGRTAGQARGGNKALAALERRLTGRDYLVGDSLTIADIALYGYVHVADEGGFDLGRYPAVEAWLARVAAEPGTSRSTPSVTPLELDP